MSIDFDAEDFEFDDLADDIDLSEFEDKFMTPFPEKQTAEVSQVALPKQNSNESELLASPSTVHAGFQPAIALQSVEEANSITNVVSQRSAVNLGQYFESVADESFLQRNDQVNVMENKYNYDDRANIDNSDNGAFRENVDQNAGVSSYFDNPSDDFSFTKDIPQLTSSANASSTSALSYFDNSTEAFNYSNDMHQSSALSYFDSSSDDFNFSKATHQPESHSIASSNNESAVNSSALSYFETTTTDYNFGYQQSEPIPNVTESSGSSSALSYFENTGAEYNFGYQQPEPIQTSSSIIYPSSVGQSYFDQYSQNTSFSELSSAQVVSNASDINNNGGISDYFASSSDVSFSGSHLANDANYSYYSAEAPKNDNHDNSNAFNGYFEESNDTQYAGYNVEPTYVSDQTISNQYYSYESNQNETETGHYEATHNAYYDPSQNGYHYSQDSTNYQSYNASSWDQASSGAYAHDSNQVNQNVSNYDSYDGRTGENQNYYGSNAGDQNQISKNLTEASTYSEFSNVNFDNPSSNDANFQLPAFAVPPESSDLDNNNQQQYFNSERHQRARSSWDDIQLSDSALDTSNQDVYSNSNFNNTSTSTFNSSSVPYNTGVIPLYYPNSTNYINYNEQSNATANQHVIHDNTSSYAPTYGYDPLEPIATYREAFNSPGSVLPRPIVTFGFGGKMIVIFPERKRKLNVRAAENDRRNRTLSADDSRPGLICVKKLADYMPEVCQSVRDFPGPLDSKTNATLVSNFIDKTLVSFEQQSKNFNELRMSNLKLLWKLLNALCVKRDPKSKSDTSLESSIVQTLVHSDSVRHSGLDLGNGNFQDSIISTNQNSVSVEQREAAVSRIQHHLLLGQRDDACRIACESGLWSHALLLASHQDVTTYRSIVSKFALSQLADGSPLQSLYLLYAGHPAQLFRAYSTSNSNPIKRPSISNEHGIVENWRKNLAMLVSNPTANDRAVQIQLGDLLLSRHGQVEAAHCCYIIAEEAMDFTGNARFILVGADHRGFPRSFFRSVDAYHASEILEYSRIAHGSNLNSELFAASGGQLLYPSNVIFKYVYASLLADIGENEKALNYMERLNNILGVLDKKKTKLLFSDVLLQAMKDLEDRLRKYINRDRATTIGETVGGLFRGFTDMLIGSSPVEKVVQQPLSIPSIPVLPPANGSAVEETKSLEPLKQEQGSNLKDAKATDKKEEKDSKGGGIKGWIGSILGVKQPRQAILEKGDEFVYDKEKKRWVNLSNPDEAEEEAAPALPPPRLQSTTLPPGPGLPSGGSVPTFPNPGPAGGIPKPSFGSSAPSRGVGSRYAQMAGADIAPPTVNPLNPMPLPSSGFPAQLNAQPSNDSNTLPPRAGYSGRLFVPKPVGSPHS